MAGRIVKQSGKNTAQQKRSNGQSYEKQLSRISGRIIAKAPRQSDTKRRGW